MLPRPDALFPSSKQTQRQNVDRNAADILSVLFRDLGVLNALKSGIREGNNSEEVLKAKRSITPRIKYRLNKVMF